MKMARCLMILAALGVLMAAPAQAGVRALPNTPFLYLLDLDVNLVKSDYGYTLSIYSLIGDASRAAGNYRVYIGGLEVEGGTFDTYTFHPTAARFPITSSLQIPVSKTSLGWITLTRIPSGASSRAATRASCVSPALATE